MPDYDESILLRMSERLYGRAVRVLVYLSLLGAVIGAIGGAALASGAQDGGVTLLGLVMGGFFGALVGFVVAMERAFMLRLQAQMILVQVQIERNTRAGAANARAS